LLLTKNIAAGKFGDSVRRRTMTHYSLAGTFSATLLPDLLFWDARFRIAQLDTEEAKC
jgi:hypothetical protein